MAELESNSVTTPQFPAVGSPLEAEEILSLPGFFFDTEGTLHRGEVIFVEGEKGEEKAGLDFGDQTVYPLQSDATGQ